MDDRTVEPEVLDSRTTQTLEIRCITTEVGVRGGTLHEVSRSDVTQGGTLGILVEAHLSLSRSARGTHRGVAASRST